MAGRVTSARLVGRVGELAELEAALADAAAGRPSLVVLTGESGVGKTRLLSEFEGRAAASGARVLRGECVALGETELPYGPLLAALRALARDGDAVLDGLPRGARAELARLLPSLASPDELPAGGEAAQLYLFEAVLTVLDRLGERDPVVLAIEDLHWADRSTRAFVAFLARSLRTERTLLVVTYRPEELHRRHPLRPLLAELERADRARRIELGALAPDELVDVLAGILGAAPSDEVAGRLFARSEGNPLYAEELLAAGLDGRGALPASLRDALRIRLERLSEPAQELLRAVAVGGRVDQPLLAEVGDDDERALRDALREAVDGNVIVVDGGGGLAFRHALLREVAYEDLLPGERAQLHLAFARALERRADAGEGDEDELAPEVAHHYLSAGDQPAALGAAVRAAEAAERVHAHGEAAALLERALELWPRVPDAEARTGGDCPALLCRAADAHLAGGDRARAEVLLRAALDDLDADADPRRAAAALARLARVQWALNRGEEAIESAQRALDMLPAADGGAERASLLSWWAMTRMLRGRYRDAIDAAREALDAAAAAGDEPSRGQALKALGVSLMARGRVDEGAAALRQALAIAEEHERPDEAAEAYGSLADSLHLAGRTREALRTAREGMEAVSAMLGRRPESLAIGRSEYAFEAGEWDEAASQLPAAGRTLVGRLLIDAELRRAELALGRGERAGALALDAIEPLVARSWEAQFHGGLGALLADLRRREGDLDGAREAVETALDRLEFCTDDVMRIARVAAAGVATEADRAQFARDRGDAAAGRAALARARAFMTRVRAAARPGGPVERAWRATAEADLARARGRGDPARWASAAAAWDELERPYLAAVARWREAEADVEAGDRAAGAEAARDALATARRLGSRWLEAEVEGLAARGRLRLDAAPASTAPGAAQDDRADEPFGLTPRERQVLALLAAGATNREIGTTLYMAEKTASVHVSRILAKLEVRSRTQAAAVAHRLGLGELTS